MQQLYLLSVVLNLLGGLVLLAPRVKDENVRSLAQRPAVHVTVGVLAFLAGVAKLILPAPMEEVMIVGDLLPALAGMALGVVMVGDVYASRSKAAAEGSTPRKNLLLRIPIAVIAIAAAIAHFLFPATVIL
jgi:hypothetical protein